MIESPPRAPISISAMPLVLHVRRWLDIPSPVGKLKPLLRSGIELRRRADGVLQRLMHRTENPVDTRFPIVTSMMASDVATHIAFSVTTVLRDDHRCRQRIRRQSRARIAHAAGKTQEQIRRDRMLEKNLPRGFAICDVLPLPGFLLDQLIWHKESHLVVSHHDAQSVLV